MPQFPKPKLPLRKQNDENGKQLDTSQNAKAADAKISPIKTNTTEKSPANDAVALVDDDRKVFYINVTVHDASEAIREKVTQKISAKQESLPGPQKFKDKVAKSVANRAAATVPPSKIAEKMAQKMPHQLPMKMKQRGLTVAVDEVFREGPYFVLQVQVKHVDMAKLLEESQKEKDEEEEDDDDSAFSDGESSVGDESAETSDTATTVDRSGLSSFVDWILSLMGVRVRSHIESEYLPAMIQKKMSKTMESMLHKKYASKNIKAEAKTFPEEKQARYFYANLKKVKAES